MSGTKRWNVIVKTSNVDSAGTDSNVYIRLFGDNDETDNILLDNPADNFERNSVDSFRITLKDVGKPYKLRVFHDNSGGYPGWHLDWIEMEHLDSTERYKFPCNRWLSVTDDDHAIERELSPLKD